MSEQGGLQIDLRCVKCGTPPTIASPLFEMQNHLYICNTCRIEEERHGKRIAWVAGLQLDDLAFPPAITDAPSSEPAQTPQPPNRFFAILELPMEATEEHVRVALKDKMRYWMKHEDASKKADMIEQLREWQEELNSDPHFLEKQRPRPQAPATPSQGSALPMTQTDVYTLTDFVMYCEQNKEDWEHGEQYLISGELEYWIYAQTGNPNLARIAHSLAKISNESGSQNDEYPTQERNVRWFYAQIDGSDHDQATHIPARRINKHFLALNTLLYHLLPSRPFRFYATDHWQPCDPALSAPNPQTLAHLCDLHWRDATYHLYEGTMITWLEHSQGQQALHSWYTKNILPYQRDSILRGLGLELTLERVVPSLPQPQMTITFDGQQDRYTLTDWDNEIPHQPITIKIHNATRGMTVAEMQLVNLLPPVQAGWIFVEDSQTSTPTHTASSKPFYNRPGEINPTAKYLHLHNLSSLSYGKTYSCTLLLTYLRAYEQPRVEYTYPLLISTLPYRQGFRRYLWLWGLRGNITGLLWNFLVGAALALLATLLVQALSPVPSQDFWNTTLTATRSLLTTSLRWNFVLATASITGLIGACVGFGKGHANYPVPENGKTFRKFGFWCSLIAFITFVVFIQGNPSYLENYIDYAAISGASWLISFLLSLLLLLLICITSWLRSFTENALRKHYTPLLTPEGSK